MVGEDQPLLGDPSAPMDYCDQMDQVVRNGFIRKVYSILSVQLITTVLIAIPFNAVPAVQEFVGRQPALLYLIIALNITFLLVLTCCPNMARRHPTNYALLAGFTVTESALIGVITSMYKTSIVLLAVGITAGIVVGLTLYAFKTDADWTGAGPYLFAAVLCLMLFGLICMFFPNPFMHKIYCGLGALIFSFYLVYDTQIIVGGKHKQFRLGVDEYVFGALALYLDIINLFIYILQILGNDR